MRLYDYEVLRHHKVKQSVDKAMLSQSYRAQWIHKYTGSTSTSMKVTCFARRAESLKA